MPLPVSRQNSSGKLRVAVFGSYYRGFYVLNELLFGPLRDRVNVVGVATDDPGQSFISRDKRVWQYPHTPAETRLVRDLASSHQISVFEDRVKHPNFRDVFYGEWRPDLCVMATFGQLIDETLFTYPSAGFFNLHPYDGGRWPSEYAGGNPFHAMIRDDLRSCAIGLHHVDATFDTGALVAKSERIAIPPGVSVPEMHKITSPLAALLLRQTVEKILEGRAH
jgi:methionyl-tRNA formyltransferase